MVNIEDIKNEQTTYHLHIPSRDIPQQTEGILQDVRRYIHTQLRKREELKDIQMKLEKKYNNDFTLFMHNWVRFHPNDGSIYRDPYLKQVPEEQKAAGGTRLTQATTGAAGRKA